MGVRLPPEYQEVVYIQMQQTNSYIDTKVYPDKNTKVEIKFKDPVTNGGGCFFGAANQNNGTPSFRLHRNYSEVGRNNVVTSFPIVEVDVDHIATVSQECTIIDGVRYENENAELSGALNYSLFLCGYNMRGSNYGQSAWRMVIYWCKIYDENTLIRNFVPCYRLSDNKVGLYDLVTEEFYLHSGQLPFIKGPDVIDSISPWLVARRRMLMQKLPRLPFAYQEVEWLQGTGTQYINTELPISLISDLTTEWRLQLAITSSEEVMIPLGTNANNKQLPFMTTRKYRRDWCVPSGIGSSTSAISLNTVHTIEQKNGTLIINNESSAIGSTSSSQAPFGLFAKLNGSGDPEVATISLMKLYSFTASVNGNNISNMIPCYRKLDGKPGLYDMVRNKFLTNRGSGEFIVGPDIN